MTCESKPHPRVESHGPPVFWLKRNMPSLGAEISKAGVRDEWCWRFKLKSISPFSILKMNTPCQILLEKTSQALRIQKHKCPGIDMGRCVGLWVFNAFLFVQEAEVCG